MWFQTKQDKQKENDYIPVYSNEEEKKIFLSDFDYDKKIKKLQREQEYCFNEIKKVKENPTYEKLIKFPDMYRKLTKERTNMIEMEFKLRDCKFIENRFLTFYNTKYSSIAILEYDLENRINTLQQLARCKPYLTHTLGRKLNIDLSQFTKYDYIKKEDLILNKKVGHSFHNAFDKDVYYNIEMDFRNGYYYTLRPKYILNKKKL